MWISSCSKYGRFDKWLPFIFSYLEFFFGLLGSFADYLSKVFVVEVLLSDHSLSSVSMGSVPGAFAAARTDFTSAGKYGNDADATNDLVSEYVLVAWYRTSFMIYNMDSRSLNNGRVAEYADKNRMAPFNQYGFWESCTYRDLLSGRAVFENPFSCFLFALARTWYNTYLHFAL